MSWKLFSAILIGLNAVVLVNLDWLPLGVALAFIAGAIVNDCDRDRNDKEAYEQGRRDEWEASNLQGNDETL